MNFDDTVPMVSCENAEFGTNTNGEFTVTASDNSGNVKLYHKKDNAVWETSGASYTVKDTAEEGIYYFYAVDDYGNATSEMWVTVGIKRRVCKIRYRQQRVLYLGQSVLDGNARRKAVHKRGVD